MRKIPLSLIVLLCAAGAARASPEMFHPGTGVPNVVSGSRDAIWSEPADLNGLIVDSEQILQFGLESEVANDFVSEGPWYRMSVAWWGGFYSNSSPCQSGITTPGFNIRIYESDGCVPGGIIAEISTTSFDQTSIGCQDGWYPLFYWETYLEGDVPLVHGQVYWLGIQMRDHPFPPQAGRLASSGVVGCETVFKSVYFGFPDWTPVSDLFGVSPFDASQELRPPPPIGGGETPYGACCFDHGHCRLMSYADCTSQGGQYLGDQTGCLPQNPCDAQSDVSEGRAVTKQNATWGEIKGLYR